MLFVGILREFVLQREIDTLFEHKMFLNSRMNVL